MGHIIKLRNIDKDEELYIDEEYRINNEVLKNAGLEDEIIENGIYAVVLKDLMLLMDNTSILKFSKHWKQKIIYWLSKCDNYDHIKLI